MNAFALIQTASGPLRYHHISDTGVYRVGYPVGPWSWTPWEYADHGRFDGRWDDPDGIWRTLYVGSSALVCYLEVLAREPSAVTRTFVGSTSVTVSMAVQNVAAVSRTNSDSRSTCTKNPSVASSTAVTSHSASRTSTTEPGAAVNSAVRGLFAIRVTATPVGG
ncbi:RES domain-containing protein [Mycobacterium sp. M1]|uniref:RES domain-containing protein n=1 Tax=Mycolicibacter acidiphilus TaxID=2835306 RepID=A0ABS5RDF3_9MYCO|nr:RES domain-containing protein [Mycolicibacter acidiphilus]